MLSTENYMDAFGVNAKQARHMSQVDYDFLRREDFTRDGLNISVITSRHMGSYEIIDGAAGNYRDCNGELLDI